MDQNLIDQMNEIINNNKGEGRASYNKDRGTYRIGGNPNDNNLWAAAFYCIVKLDLKYVGMGIIGNGYSYAEFSLCTNGK